MSSLCLGCVDQWPPDGEWPCDRFPGLDCEPPPGDPPPCGGFPGLECPGDLVCVDDPTDDCDPAQGGADCIGICIEDEPQVSCDEDGESCAMDEYCSFGPEPSCGGDDAEGTCEPRPEVCTLIYEPVCGCDGVTYGNACEAAAAGMNVAYEGPCEGDTDSAGSTTGGDTESSSSTSGADDSASSTSGADESGTSTSTESGTSTSGGTEGTDTGGQDACGGLLGLTCDDGEYCKFPLDAFCGTADALGMCRPIPEVCTEIYNPVCGCDGQTYGNACEAAAAGVSVASYEACM